MNLIKCPNNHYYDASKFQTCPHCNVGNQSPVQGNPQKVNPHFVQQPQGMNPPQMQPQQFQQRPVSVPNNQPTAPVDNGQGDVMTVPAESARVKNPSLEDKPTVPMDQPTSPQVISEPARGLTDVINDVNKRSNEANEEDQHTIGYYDTSAPDSFLKGVQPVVGWLVVISGEMKGTSINIYTGRSSIGRGKSNDVVIEGDKSISRERHAVIVFEPKNQAFLLQPGSSRELFYLNGDVVLETTKLSAYDKIEIGKTTLLFVPLCGENFSWESTEGE